MKRFKCSECEYGFYDLSNFKQHVKSVHDKVRDNTCDLCDYAGSKKNSLVQHMKRHHDRCPGRQFNNIEIALGNFRSDF